ncbi:AaceriADR226Cp [[Ashbya] aceris (nom. inval.)]|nr:AaceriADR226Cp [[Ashbya] aceris (nom. inval.)]
MADQYEARTSSQGALNVDRRNSISNENFFDIEEEDFLDMYPLSARQRLIYQFKRSSRKLLNTFVDLPLWKQAAVLLLCGGATVSALLMMVFHKSILERMIKISNELRSWWYTPLIFFLLIFCVSFPPMIGFSMLCTSAGLVYGVSFKGWFIISLGTVLGSIAAFSVFKTVFHSYAERLIRMNHKFEALASILQDHNSYWIIALLRLCPFPYSLTNGAIAGVYGISTRNFSIAQVLTTPKLFMYLFIGSRLKNLGESSSTATKLFDILSILFAIIALTATASILYYKTKDRYLELQRRNQDRFDTLNF